MAVAPPAIGDIPPSAPLGREGPARELGRWLDAARGGVGRIVVVRGDPGAGKTHLLETMVTWADELGMTSHTAAAGVDGREIAAALHDLAGGGLLVIDDLHRLAAATHRRLEELARAPAPGVLVALGQRPRQVRVAVREGVDLGPLTDEQAGRLLSLSLAEAHHLVVNNGGLPRYLLAAVGSEGDLETALVEEITRLPPAAQDLLESAAVLGHEVDVGTLQRISRLGSEPTLAAIDVLCEADLLRPAERPGLLTFRHRHVRDAVYRDIGMGARLSQHRAADAALESTGAGAVARAPHLAQTATIGDTEAAPLLAMAADEVIHHSPDTAAQWYAAAIRLCAPAPSTDMWRLRVGYAMATGLAGHMSESRSALHDLLATMPDTHPGRLEVVGFCLHMERALGRHAEARALAARERRLQAPDPEADAVLGLSLAVSLIQLDTPVPDILATLDGVCTAAVHLSDGVLLGGALGLVSLVTSRVDRLPEAASAVDGATDKEVAARLDAVCWLAWSELRLSVYRDALRHYQRALAVARATGQVHLDGNLLVGVANTLRWLGDLRQAQAVAQEAVAHTSSFPADTHVLALCIDSWISTLRGDPTTGLTTAIRATEQARGMKGWWPTLAQLRAAHACLAAGDHARALDELCRGGGGIRLPAVPPTYQAEFYELCVRAAVGSGQPGDAWSGWAADTAEALDHDGSRAFAELVRARVLAAAGDDTGAAAAATSAANRFAGLDQRLEEAEANAVLADALGPLGGVARARAHELFAACGTILPATPDRSHERPSQLAGLTRRELDVARLVAEGLTNRQVARRLTISEKTVEGHLSKVMAKLEVTSRAGVARVLTQAERPDD